MPYTIPALTRGEVSAASKSNHRPVDCERCKPGFPVERWRARLGISG